MMLRGRRGVWVSKLATNMVSRTLRPHWSGQDPECSGVSQAPPRDSLIQGLAGPWLPETLMGKKKKKITTP